MIPQMQAPTGPSSEPTAPPIVPRRRTDMMDDTDEEHEEKQQGVTHAEFDQLQNNLREDMAELRNELREILQARVEAKESEKSPPLGQQEFFGLDDDDDDDDEMEDAGPKRNLKRPIKAGGSESLDEYSRLSASITEGLGHAFEKALRGENDYKCPSKSEVEADLFERKQLILDKFLVRARPGEIQQLLGMSLSETVTTSKIRSRFKKGQSQGMVARATLAIADDIVVHLIEGLDKVEGAETVPVALVKEFGLYLMSFIRLSSILVRIGIKYPQLADSVGYTLTQDTFCKFNDSHDPALMVADLNRPNINNDVQALVEAERAARAALAHEASDKDRVCYAFRNSGSCRFGDACKFKHAGAGSGADGFKRRRVDLEKPKRGVATLKRLLKKTKAGGGYEPYPGAKKHAGG